MVDFKRKNLKTTLDNVDRFSKMRPTKREAEMLIGSEKRLKNRLTLNKVAVKCAARFETKRSSSLKIKH